MSQLASKKCIPCSGGVPRMSSAEIENLRPEIPDWQIVDDHHLSREFRFPDFMQAQAFVNQVGAVAEEEGHHPNIFFTYGQARIDIWTHSIDGLTESDFILAAKIDQIS